MRNNLIKKYISLVCAIFMVSNIISCSRVNDRVVSENLTDSSKNITGDEASIASFDKLEEEIRSINKSNKDESLSSSWDTYNSQRPAVNGSKFSHLYDYSVNSDLSNVANWFQFEFDAEEKEKISKNGFITELTRNKSFSDRYIKNNSLQIPNYITVDSVTYIYSLYISYLKAKLESQYLSEILLKLTHEMLDESKIIYEELKGSSWESAAKRNVLYFTVALSLQEYCIPEEYIETEFQIEQALIDEGSTSAPSTLTLIPRNYSLLKPTMQYLWNDNLAKYYRTLTWYRLMSLPQDNEDFIRSAFLIALTEENIASNYYDTLISLSSFMYGTKDEVTCFDYKKIIRDIYEKESKKDDQETVPKDSVIEEILSNNNISNPKIDSKEYTYLIENENVWTEFNEQIKNLEVKKHNFVSYDQFDKDKALGNSSDIEQGRNTFCFIPNAYSIDDYIFNMLIKDAVAGRDFTNSLDLAAVLGSEDAENILIFSNEGLYAGYLANLYTLRRELYEVNEYGDLGLHMRVASPSTVQEKIGHTNDRYDNFIDSGGIASENLDYYFLKAIRGLLYDKSELSPKFMNSNLWHLRAIESFCGAYTQFKNGFNLYSEEKGNVEDTTPKYLLNDDSGFVETEPQIFKRLFNLGFIIKNGLKKFNLLDNIEEENLNRLMSLTDTLYECAKKEEEGAYLSKAEFEIIRDFGDEVLYFEDILKKFIMTGQNLNVEDEKYEMSISSNIGELLSTNDSKSIMQVSLGPISDIYIAILVNGELKIAAGTMYSFYQFKNSKENRLSTKTWNEIVDNSQNYKSLSYETSTPSNMIRNKITIEKPDWTKDYTYSK